MNQTIKSNLFSLYFLVFFFISFSSNAKENIEDIINKEDHKSCYFDKINISDLSSTNSMIYWTCRYNLAKSRLLKDASDPMVEQRNFFIKKVISKIKNQLSQSKRFFLYDLENREYTVNQKLLECFFSDDNKLNNCAPGSKNFKTIKQDDYVASYNSEAPIISKKYPLCSNKWVIGTKEFSDCSKRQDMVRTCLLKLTDIMDEHSDRSKKICNSRKEIFFQDNREYSLNNENIFDKKLIMKKSKERANLFFYQNSSFCLKDEYKITSNKKVNKSKIKLEKLKANYINNCMDGFLIDRSEIITQHINKCRKIGNY